MSDLFEVKKKEYIIYKRMEPCPCDTCEYNTAYSECDYPCDKYFEWYDQRDFTEKEDIE